MSIDDVLARLSAGLAEDERIAREAISPDSPSGMSEKEENDFRHNPARVLRDVEAMRKVLAEHEKTVQILRKNRGVIGSAASNKYTEGYQDACEAIIEALAGIYAEPTEETGDR